MERSTATTMDSAASGAGAAANSPASRELTHEDVVYMKKCRDEAFIYAQLPLTGLLTGLVGYRHRAGHYSHLSLAAVFGRYLFAFSSGVVLGLAVYVPICLNRVTSSDMVDSVLQDQVLRQQRQRGAATRVVPLDANSRLRVPTVGPTEPFRDAFLEAVRPSEGFTTYKQRREFSRQMAMQQQQGQWHQPNQQSEAVAALAAVENEYRNASVSWQ